MEGIGYNDFRGFVEAAKKVSEWRAIDGADWDGEIGALIEATAELDSRPMLEHYPVGAAFDPKTGVFDCMLCIPVQPL